MERYLRNCLRLPFQEPAFLRHGLSLEGACVPSFKYESKTECLRFTKLWDCRGLQSLFGAPLAPCYFCSFFWFIRIQSATAKLVTGGSPRPMNFTLMDPESFCLQGPCCAKCMYPDTLIAFLGRLRIGATFTIKLRSALRGPKRICCHSLSLCLFLRAAKQEFCAKQKAAGQRPGECHLRRLGWARCTPTRSFSAAEKRDRVSMAIVLG